MKKIIKSTLFVCIIIVFGLLLFGCGNTSDNITKATAKPVINNTPEPKAQTVTCYFYDRGTLLADQVTLSPGDSLNITSEYVIPSDGYNNYTFHGWDANGDGIAETFPYVVNEDTNFVAIVTQEAIVYHYDIYVKGELRVSTDAGYGETINYPAVTSHMDGDNAYLFCGWKYDGVYDGYTRNQVDKSYRIDAYFAESQILKVYYNGTVYAQILNSGLNVFDIDYIKEIVPGADQKVVWYLDSACTREYTTTAMPEGNLTIYGKLVSTKGNNATAIKTQAEMLDAFNGLLLSRKTTAAYNVEYNFGSPSDLVNYLTSNSLNLYGYQVSAKSQGKYVEFTISYSAIANKKSTNVIYTQLTPYNVKKHDAYRSSSYNDFAINKVNNMYVVNNSEALYYVIEQGYQPVIEASNTELNNLYNKMKNVLRECVNDSMTDIEKARAIYEYLILNVTYDADVLNKIVNGGITSGYNSFYLEGVFNDNLAVCDGISKAYVCLCRLEGIECVRVVGTKVDNGVAHAWNKVKLGGAWYVVDVTSGGTIVGNNEVMTYHYFMMTDAENQQYSVANVGSYTALSFKASTEYDNYVAMGISANNVTEAKNMLADFLDNAPAGTSTFEMQLNYQITSMGEAFQDILNALNRTIESISYISEGNHLVVIK